MKNSSTSSGIGIFSVLAMILSYSVNKSILWAILHGIFGIFYIIYHIIKY